MTSTDPQPWRCEDCKQPNDARHLDGCPRQIEGEWVDPLRALDGMGKWATPGSW